MSTAQPGSKAPVFCLPNQDEEQVCLKDFLGKWVVLYFYPKDNTPGCTVEAIDFSAGLQQFAKKGAIVLGVSPDSPKSHCTFQEKHQLTVTLLSDPQHEVLEKYGAWGKKKNYGREYMGVKRTTFLIDPKGKIKRVWENVKAQGHAQEVLETLANRSK